MGGRKKKTSQWGWKEEWRGGGGGEVRKNAGWKDFPEQVNLGLSHEG